MPLSIFKYASERGLSYSNDVLLKIAEEIEEVVAMKASCLTSADYYQVWSKLKGKLSLFVTGGDTVDMLGMMMISSKTRQRLHIASKEISRGFARIKRRYMLRHAFASFGF